MPQFSKAINDPSKSGAKRHGTAKLTDGSLTRVVELAQPQFRDWLLADTASDDRHIEAYPRGA